MRANRSIASLFLPPRHAPRPPAQFPHNCGAPCRSPENYDRAQTPYQRLCASGVLPPRVREDLEALYQRLHPLQLRRDLEAELDRLSTLATPDPHRQGHTEIAIPSSKSASEGAWAMASVTLNYELTSPGG